MTLSTARRCFRDGYDFVNSSANARLQRIVGGAAFVPIVFVCAFAVVNNLRTDIGSAGAGAEPIAMPTEPAAVSRASMFERAYAELATGLKHAALRSAFAAVHRDPQFLAEGQKLGIDISPVGADAVSGALDEMTHASPAVFDYMKRLVAGAKGG